MQPLTILHCNHISRTWSWNVMRHIMQETETHNIISYAFVWYDFDNIQNLDSIFITSTSYFYKQYWYKFWVGINFVFDIMTPWCMTYHKLKQYKHYQEADIIHIHCPQWWYFDWHDLPLIAQEKKIVLTIHDDRLMSGNDPHNLYFPYKRHAQFEKRKKILDQCDISYCGVSERCTQKAIQSWIVSKNTIQTIYNGIDTTVFCPQEKRETRQKLWLPIDKKIILSLAWSWWKTSMKWLWYAMKIQNLYVNNPDYLFITLGNAQIKKISDWLWEIWYVDQKTVAQYFSAADCFLYPTLMDSFGLVVAESIACGCPIVTFAVWWVPEIVKHKQDGYVAQYKDFDDLLTWFKRVLEQWNNLTPSLDKKFAQETMIEQYVNLYRSLVQ